MTVLDSQGYSDYQNHLAAEGNFYMDKPPPGEAFSNLPEKTLEQLKSEAWREFQSCSGARNSHVARLKTYWDRYDLVPYDQDRLLLAEQVNLTTPLIRSRVQQAKGNLYASLAMTPFFVASTDDETAGTAALHAEKAFSEQLEDADFENTFDQALLGSFVGTLGVMYADVQYGTDGKVRLNTDHVDLRDLFLSPHNVRDLQQCTMVAQRYYEPLYWVKDQAVLGIFDPAVTELVGGNLGMDATDGNASARDLHDLDTGGTPGGESGMVELLNIFIRTRPSEQDTTEMWRLVVVRHGWHVLRADPWTDGMPFFPLRHARGTNTIFSPSYSAILQDLQYGKDQMFSLSFEMARMSSSGIIEYDPLSPLGEHIREMEEDADGAVRLLPGQLVPSRPSQNAMKVTQLTAGNTNTSQSMNEIESMANTATIPMMPAATYRSATEHRIANGVVTSLEGQMLKTVRSDLIRFAEYAKRLYWRYVAKPLPDGRKAVSHGTVSYPMTEATFMALKFTPAGLTSQADQMQVTAASGEALQMILSILPQKQLFTQMGGWPYVYEAARQRLLALGLKDTQKLLGPPPQVDNNVMQNDPAAMQASMQLMQLLGGSSGQLGSMALPADAGVRGSDAAPTVMPGGNPAGPN